MEPDQSIMERAKAMAEQVSQLQRSEQDRQVGAYAAYTLAIGEIDALRCTAEGCAINLEAQGDNTPWASEWRQRQYALQDAIDILQRLREDNIL